MPVRSEMHTIRFQEGQKPKVRVTDLGMPPDSIIRPSMPSFVSETFTTNHSERMHDKGVATILQREYKTVARGNTEKPPLGPGQDEVLLYLERDDTDPNRSPGIQNMFD